ncbi:phage tail protein [Microvirga sp. RSM25]|uniref:phage tail protein n=1 Tax=Microvirga sp. RSM25 TaxID=3273802 RepID=UPI0038505F8B
MLYQVGALTFRVSTPNIHEVELEAAADYVAKDVIGVLRPLESVGEGESMLTLRGRLFPRKWGGTSSLDLLERMRVSGEPQIVVRGDGRNMGWWVVARYREQHSYLGTNGVGRQIDYEVALKKSPKAATALGYFSTIMRLIG